MKEKRWKRLFQKAKLDRRMAAALLFVLAAAGILLVLRMYSMKQVTTLEYGASAVPDSSVLTRLREGAYEMGEAVWLEQMEEGEPVYRRGSSWYVGESRRAFDGSAPVYVNDGTYLWLLTDGASMVTDEWLTEGTASGMYISDGAPFNFDGSATGDSAVYFLKLPSGLYMNTLSLQIEGSAVGGQYLPANNYMDIRETGIRYLARQSGEKLVYSEIPATMDTEVTLDGESMTYEQLLYRLGILTDQEETAPAERAEADETPLPETVPAEDAAGEKEDDGRDSREEEDAQDIREEEPGEEDADAGESGGPSAQESQQAASDGQSPAAGTGAPSGGQTSAGPAPPAGGSPGSPQGEGSAAADDAGDSADSGENAPQERPGEPGEGTEAGDTEEELPEGGGTEEDGADTDPDADEEESDPGDSEDGEEGEGEGESSGSHTDGDGGNAGESGGGSGSTGMGAGNPPVWVKPRAHVAYEEEDVSVYALEAALQVTDTYGCFDRAVVTMSWDREHPNAVPDGSTPVQLRRTLREAGDFYVDNLPPETKIYVAAYLYYFEEDGTKIQETEPFQTFVIETGRFEDVAPISVQFSDAIEDSAEKFYYENQIALYSFEISGSNGNAVDKVYSARLYVYKKGSDTPVYEDGFSLSSGVLANYKWTGGQDYKTLSSQYVLPANTEYRYRLEFFDRYGNSFNGQEKVFWGTARQENPEDYVRADGYAGEGDLYAPKTGDPWHDQHDKVGEESRYWGYTHTCKSVPEARMETAANADRLTTLSQIEVRMDVEDPHAALTPGAQSVPEGWLGVPPEKDGQQYRVYFMLYASSTGYEPGNERWFVYDKDARSLTIGEETSDGYKAYDSSTAGAGQHAFALSGSLPGVGGDDTWVFRGLTAGETYMIRVFATYDLNDYNPQLTQDVEIGSMRFSTTPMASYGRVYYQFTSSHVHTEQPEGVVSYDHEKYESSTAQQIDMTINTGRTLPNLVRDFFSRVDLELKYKSGSKETLATFTLARETLEKKEVRIDASQLSEDGSCRYLLEPGTDYERTAQSGFAEGQMPDLYLDIPVKAMFAPQQDTAGSGTEYYMVNLWEAFVGVCTEAGQAEYAGSMPVLQFCFGEDSLTSYTAYTLTSASTAEQGGWEHIVTANTSSARQSSFTTLKDMPYITMDDMLQVGRYLYLVGLDFHDTDQSIFEGKITVSNTDQSTGSVTELPFELDYSASEGGYIARVELSALREGRAYQLSIAPDDIRRTGRTTAPRYEDEALYTYAYTAGDGVSGQIRMQGLSYPLEQLSGTNVHVLNEYNMYEVGNFEYGAPQITGGQLNYTTDSNWQTAEPIQVSPGQIYYLNKLRASGNVHLVFLDSSRQPVGAVRTISNSCYLRIPEGVSYMQFSMYYTMTLDDGRTSVYAATQAQALKIYDTSDEALSGMNLVETVTPEDGKYPAVQGDLLAVVNGEWVSGNKENNSVNIIFTEYNASGISLGSSSVTWYPGSYYEVKNPSAASVGIGFGQDELYDVSGNACGWDVRKIDRANADVFTDLDLGRLVTTYTALVNDKAGSLHGSAEDNVIVRVWKTDSGTGVTEELGEGYSFTDRIEEYDQGTTADGLGQYTNGRYSESRSFISDTGCVYRIQLSILWRGEEYILDTQEIESDGNVYTIATGKQLLKTVTWPTGSFIVLDDLEVDEKTRSMLNQIFSGTLDGKGYSLSCTYAGSNSGFVFDRLSGSGVIENLEIKWSLNGRERGGRQIYTGFIGRNEGTVRNVVLRYNLGPGNYAHTNSGGLCRFNIGVIENFAVYFESDSTGSVSNAWGSYMGGVCYYNNGTIRNGVVYSARPLLVTTGVYGGTTDISLTSTGGVAGVNTSGGLIENVFAILEMRVERNGASQTAGSTMYHGLLAGNNSGMIRNCFTSGELYYQTWEEDASGTQRRINSSTNAARSWPGSHQQGRNYEENCYYFSGGVYSKNDIYTQYINLPAALRSQAFYDGSVNRSGAFVVESQIESGYYPIVDMPDCMDGVQDNIALSRAGFGAFPTYLTSHVTDRSQYMEGTQGQAVYHEGDVLDGAEAEALMASEAGSALGDWSAYLAPQADGTYRVQQQFALVEFIFTNSSGYNITALNVDNLTAVRLTQTDLEDSTSTVLALLTPGTWENVTAAAYSNSYLLRSFGYGYGEGGAGLEAQVENRYVNVKFYYPLSQKSWSVAPVDSNTVVNYRMIEDIRLGAKEMDLAAQTRFTNATLLGEFDGGGHTLDFAGVPAQAYFFYEIGAGAVMKDVRVENLTLGRTAGTGSDIYVGLIRRASDNASLRGIHMENVSLQNAYQYAGCLAAYVQNVQIKDCTVAGAEITSSASAYELYVGGLVGGSASGSNVSIYNSFVRDLDMRLTQGSSVAGAGGIIGYMYLGSEVRYPVVKSCYAQGEIHTNFSNCGGIAGKCNGSISGCWTDVDIYGSKNMGGIAGYVLASGTQNYNYHSNLVVSGELYTSSGEVESRLMGSWEMAAMRIPQAYAYGGQLLNSEASGDPMDAAALADADTMSEYYFWNDQSALGGAWYLYGTTAEGYGTEIPDVQDAYVYPLLYTEDGSELLPDQTAVYYETEKPDFAVASATAEKIGEENNGTYSLRLTLQLGGAGEGVNLEEYFNTYMKEQVSAEGLTLLPENPVIALNGDANAAYADVVLSLGSMEQTDEDGAVQTVSCLEAVYQKVEAVNRWDSYRITYDDGTASLSQKIVFQSTADTPEDVYLYWDISDVEDWNSLIVNGEHGSTYENFRIVQDLDFQAGSAGQGLKMNRLEGSSRMPEDYELRSQKWATMPEFTVIKNVTVSTGTTPWISEITGELKYLEFDTVTLSTATSASNLGLVGQLTGKAEYVDLARINIRPGTGTDTYTNLGCFGYVTGSIANCRAADISISGSNASYYYTNVGGVAGSVREISDVYAFGTKDGGYQVVMGNDTNIARNYFGGIAGYITGTGRGLYGENLSVTGRTYTGGLAGYLNGGVDDTVKTDEAEYQAVNVTVRGYSGAGGAFGYVRQAANARVIGGKVTSVTANAGGVIGNTYTTVRYCEAYDTSVTATEDSAGGIVGYSSWGNIYYSKAGGVQVKAVNHAGGILGSGYGLLQGCAVSGGSSGNSGNSSVQAQTDYAGGIAGRMYQSVNSGSTTHLRYNAVSETDIRAQNFSGGIAGAVNCADVCYNETDDTVTVTATTGGGGGIGGILSGGTVHHNIAGAAVDSTNYAGGIAGEAVGYGRSTASGGMVPEDYNVMRMYGNVAGNQSVKGTNYVAGLIGQFNSGDPVIDPETGKDISEEAGWTEYMANTNFYGNTIAAEEITSSRPSSRTLSWYANYDTEGAGYTSGSMAQTPRYDCLAEHLVSETNLQLPATQTGQGGKEDGLTVVAQAVLETPDFYTKTAADGGMGFNSVYINTDGLEKGYYPYVKTPNFTEKNQAARTIQVPYQSKDSEAYNCIWLAGTDGTAVSAPFDGEGIPIAEGSTISLFDLNAAENIAYASGIDTLNLDFTHIDSEMAGFKILDAYGRTLLPDTTVLSAAGGGKVCTVGYDYQTDIVVVLYSADYTEQRTYAYKAEQLRNSVMAWDGGYYYLAGDGVRRAAGDGETELAVEGSFVHLYDGKALAQDGTVVELP